MANIIRDARGVSDMELYLKDALHRGEKYISIAPFVQVLEDLETLRRQQTIVNNLQVREQELRRNIAELEAIERHAKDRFLKYPARKGKGGCRQQPKGER